MQTMTRHACLLLICLLFIHKTKHVLLLASMTTAHIPILYHSILTLPFEQKLIVPEFLSLSNWVVLNQSEIHQKLNEVRIFCLDMVVHTCNSSYSEG